RAGTAGVGTAGGKGAATGAPATPAMASGRCISSRRRTRAKAAWTRGTSSRSSVSGRAISWGVWAQAKAPTSISPSRRHPREHLVEHLVGERAHLVAREGLDRMLHHDRAVGGGAERLRLGLRRAGELGRDDRRRGNTVILEEHAVVHTARRAGPSVGERLDEHVGGADDLVSQRVGRRPREGRLLLAHDGLRRRALVPPAPRIWMCSGARNLGIGVASCSGSANLRSTCSGRPSPPFLPGTSSWTGRCSRSKRNRRTSAFDQPSPATTAACSGDS